jgi:hypothetical protein
VKIPDTLKEGAIIAELNATDKKGVLEELTAPLPPASGQRIYQSNPKRAR